MEICPNPVHPDRSIVFHASQPIQILVSYSDGTNTTINRSVALDIGKNSVNLGSGRSAKKIRIIRLKTFSDLDVLKPEERQKVEWLTGLGVFTEGSDGEALYLTRRMTRSEVQQALQHVAAYSPLIKEGILSKIMFNEKTVTREQLMTALLQLEGIDVLPAQKLAADWNPFSDISIIHPSFPVAAAAYRQRILQNSLARPGDVLTRSDFLDLLWNAPAVISEVNQLQNWSVDF